MAVQSVQSVQSVRLCFISTVVFVLFRGSFAANVAQNTDVEINKNDLSALLAVKTYLSKYSSQFPFNTWNGTNCKSPFWMLVLCDDNGRVTLVDLQNRELSVRIGPIIRNLSRLSALRTLALATNKLTGSIPSSIGNLSKLTQLLLNNNKLTGNIPSTINKLTNIYYMDLHNNSLSGSIPKINALNKLGQLFLNNNNLTGSIPKLNNLTTLWMLSLEFNKLTGLIPDVGNLNLNVLELNNNLLTGPLNLSKLGKYGAVVVDVSNNFLSGVPSLPINGISNCTLLSYNCFRFKTNGTCGSPKQRPRSECDKFCNASQPLGACGGHGTCSSVNGSCKCDHGYSACKSPGTCTAHTTFSPPKGKLSPHPPKKASPPLPKKLFPPPPKKVFSPPPK